MSHTPTQFDATDFILAYEGGDVSPEQLFEGFQNLIDSGLAWKLQGHYGRTAMDLIKQGLCTTPDRAKAKEAWQTKG